MLSSKQTIGALLVLFIQVNFFVAFGQAVAVSGVPAVAAVTDVPIKNDPITTPSTTVTPPTSSTTPIPPTTPPTTPSTSTTPTPSPTTPSTTTTTTTTTAAPSTSTTTTKAPPTPAPSRHFDMPSFIGGIVLTLGMIGIGFVGHKIYKSKFDRNYHTL